MHIKRPGSIKRMTEPVWRTTRHLRLTLQSAMAKDLIMQFLNCPEDQFLAFLSGFRDRPKFKVRTLWCRKLTPQEDFFHWIDVFDRFDDVLARAAPPAATDSPYITVYSPGEVGSLSS